MSGRKLGRGLDSLIGRGGRRLSPATEEEGGGERAEAPTRSPLPMEDGSVGKPDRPEAAAGERSRESPDDEDASAGRILELPVAAVAPNPKQPRRRFSAEELEMLKASIAREGVLQPVLVRRVSAGRYELVAGERRLRASVELGIETLPALVIDAEDDRMLELALIENIQRHDLNPIEVAEAYRNLLETRGLTQGGLAKILGVSRSSVANTIRLLELPEDIRDAVERSRISLGHAKVLVSVGDEAEQRRLFDRIAEENLSVRDLEEERDSRPEAGGEGERKRRAPRKKKPPQIESLEQQFSERLGTKVTIHEGRGKGRIQIEFYSREDFERIRDAVLSE